MISYMIYGLTGGIATGKSTVARMFHNLGANIVDADQVSREVVEPGEVGADRIHEHFGDDVFTDDGGLDRSKLASIIFQDSKARETLNQLLHPLIMQKMIQKTNDIKHHDTNSIIIWDVPLLFEKDLTHYVQKVIVVFVPEDLQLIRLIQRNNLTIYEAKHRIKAQWPIMEKKKLADYVIDNSGTVKQTEEQVVALWKHLT